MVNVEFAPEVAVTGFIMPTTVADPVNAILLPIFALLAILITYLPFRSFYRVKNIAACSIMFALIVINLMALINGILWPSDNWSDWWSGNGLCDVEVMIRYPITMTLACSLCCLSKGLADALDTEKACMNPSTKMRRRKIVIEVLFCWAIPIMQMCLHYMVQAGRYMVAPVWGCADQLDNSWLSIAVILMWCPIFTLLNVYYAGLMLIRLFRYRSTISAALSSTGSGLAPRKFIKLALISIFLLIFYVPLTGLFIYYAMPTTLVPYSWSRIHHPATWDPILFVHTEDQPSLQWYGWAGVIVSGLMFAFFGFNDDAVDTYRAILVSCGLGNVWPSLRLSREERKVRDMSGETLTSRGSFASHLDLVGKAMKYFDASARKDSSASGITLVNGSSMTSHKGSQATLSNTTTILSQVTTNASNISTFPLHPNSNAGDADIISPAPSHFNDSNFGISPTTFTHGQTSPSTSTPLQTPLITHRGIFSIVRTHLNLPFNSFTFGSSSTDPTKTKSSPGTQQAEMTTLSSASHSNFQSDIEAQNHSPYFPRRTSSVPSQNPTAVHSHIWSGPGITATNINSNAKSDPHHVSHEIIGRAESLYSLSPKMGSRAYRERERREMASSASSYPVKSAPSQKMHTQREQDPTHTFAYNVHQVLGMDILPPTPTPTQENGMAGVIVRRSLDISEERR